MRYLIMWSALIYRAKQSFAILPLLCLCNIVIFAAESQANYAVEPYSFAPIVEKAMPAIVNISTKQTVKNTNPFDEFRMEIPEGGHFDLFREFFEREFQYNGKPRKASSLGSGFVIDATGYIVTNYHVIENADEVKVTIGDKVDTPIVAKIIGYDEKTDLALLKVDTKEPLPHLPFANSDTVRVGDPVLAIGNPFGIGASVTAGIISAKSRALDGAYDEFIQIDASINKGNSGGPSLNAKGEVIGVNAVIISPSGGNVGIGLAIPANTVTRIVADLKTKGTVERSWLGVQVQNITQDIANSFKLPNLKGALVNEVAKNSPAEKAGLKVADIILSVNNQSIDTTSKLPRVVGLLSPGTKVEIHVMRNGQLTTLYAVLEKKQGNTIEENNKDKQSVDDSDLFGMQVSDITNQMRMQYHIPKELSGIMITKVKKGSNAYDIGLKPGDIISKVNTRSINSKADWLRVIKECMNNKEKHVLLYILRDGSAAFTTMSLEE